MADVDQKAIVQRMIDAGESEENIATVIQHFKTTAAAPASHSTAKEPDTWMGGAVKGLREGVAGGAKGFVQGMAESPGNLVSGVGTMLTQPVTKTVGDTFDAIGRIPAAVRGAGADPEGWGRDVGNLTGQTMLTAAAPAMLPKVPALARGAVGAVPKVATVAANVIEHPVVAPVLGAAAGYAHSGPIGALGGLVGEEVFKPHLVRVLRKIGAMGKTPALPDILDEVTAAKTEPVEPFKPVLTSGEPPAPGSVTPKQLNEARLAEIRAAYKAKQAPAAAPAPAAAVTPAAAAEPSRELATRMQTIRNTPSAGSETHYPGNAGMPQGPNMHDVAARTVDAYQMPSSATEARAQWNPKPASAAESDAAAAALEPIPLSQAVTAVRQAATVAKQKLTATEFTEATRLAKAGHPAESVLEAIQVQRALKQQPAFAGLPTDAEMRADMGNRARGGQKSLMGAYGDEPAVAGNPYR